MYRIALCDDDSKFLEIVDQKVQKYCLSQKIDIQTSCFSDSGILAEMIEREHIFDAYILDIEMQDYTGLELVDLLKPYAGRVGIILLTAHDVYAVKACGMQILKYVMKEQLNEELPYALDELFTCLERVNQDKLYLIENQHRFHKIRQKEILYVRKSQKNSVFFLENGSEVKERQTLEKTFQKLDNEDMVFLDRGIIINLFHVKAVSECSVEMDNGYKIYTGSGHISELKKSLSVFWGKRI